jgi:serine/threonine-protein phosphatase 6 regulatory ankyrin repeat subunit B
MIASRNGHIEIIKLLLRNSADVNAEQKDGSTALMFACAYNRIEAVDLLLQYKAKLYARNRSGNTPLYIGRFFNNYLKTKFMIT